MQLLLLTSACEYSVGSFAKWSSKSDSVAAMDPGFGVVVAKSPGTTEISHTLDEHTTATQVTPLMGALATTRTSTTIFITIPSFVIYNRLFTPNDQIMTK